MPVSNVRDIYRYSYFICLMEEIFKWW